MPNITITNIDLGSVALEVWGSLDGATLRNAEVTPQTFAEGTLLARAVADGKLYPYDPADVLLDIPKYVLTYEVVALASSDNPVSVMSAGKVNQRRLKIHDGTPVAAVHLDALLDRPIIPVDLEQLSKIDNPQS